jgi:hypothetical protein
MKKIELTILYAFLKQKNFRNFENISDKNFFLSFLV